MGEDYFDLIAEKYITLKKHDDSYVAYCSSKMNKLNIETLFIPEEHKGKKIISFSFLNVPTSVKKIVFSKNIAFFSDKEEKVDFKIEIDAQNIKFWTDGVGVYSKDKTKFWFLLNNPNITFYSILENTQYIDFSAFAGRPVESICLPESISRICPNSFHGCVRLREIQGNEKVVKENPDSFKKTIFDEDCIIKNDMSFSKDMLTFKGALPLFDEDIIIPEGVKYIATNAFNIGRYNRIICPSTLEDIETFSFSYCNAKEVIFKKVLKEIKYSSFTNCKIENLILPEGIEVIQENAFSNAVFGHISLPKSLRRIEERAFSGVEVKQIDLPEGLEYIDCFAFYQTKLKKVTIPKSVKKIGGGAFVGCKSIEVYDSIDPDGYDCYNPSDRHGHRNMMGPGVGCAGEGFGYWPDHEIVVLSSETGEIKYKVWMGTGSGNSGKLPSYRGFLEEAFGKNATFPFAEWDEWFTKLSQSDIKKQIAQYRLNYPIDLTPEMKEKYEKYVARY